MNKDMLWEGLYNQCCAIECLGVTRKGPGLNVRGERILRYLRKRRWRFLAQ